MERVGHEPDDGRHPAAARSGRPARPEEQFTRQWNTPGRGDEMKRLGIERPEQLGALSSATRRSSDVSLGGARALTDDDPKLIEAPSHPGTRGPLLGPRYRRAARQRFQTARSSRASGPAALRVSSVPISTFSSDRRAHVRRLWCNTSPAIEDVHRVLTRSTVTHAGAVAAGEQCDIQQVVARTPRPRSWRIRCCSFIAESDCSSERDYGAAAAAFAIAEQGTDVSDNAFALHVYALCMAGETREAEELTKAPFRQSLSAGGVSPDSVRQASLPPFWLWMKETFGIDPRN